MQHMKFETPDMVDKNIERVKALKELFPSVVTETRGEDGEVKKGINFEVLKQLLSHDVVDGNECYEFTWVGKKAAMAEAARPTTKTLRPVKEDSRDWDTTENLYIEGDNLEVLKILQESYLGKVKMIYIDPPYNTGNDFIYADDFRRSQAEENEQMGMYDEDENRLFKNTDSNGYFHSDWCSMIYSRLLLARNLLSDDGIIFISIDGNEIDNLRKIGNEVFGESNVIPIFNRVTKKSSNSGNNFSPCVDYVLIYAKAIKNVVEFVIPLSDDIKSRYKYSDEYESERGKYQEVGLFQSALKHGGSCYPIECPDGEKVIPPNGQPWRWNQATFSKGLAEGRIVFKRSDHTGLLDYDTSKQAHWNVYTKVYLSEREDKGIHPKNFSDEYQNTLASNELNKLDIPFDFAKPKELISFFVELMKSKDAIILDFFSGSATTAHAVMQLNTEDGGHRKFIMVQLQEPCDECSEAYKAGYKNICEIGKERIRRAGDKIKADNPLGTQNLDTGFRVFRVDESNMKDVYYHPEELTQMMIGETVSNIKEGRTDLDLLYACLLDWGVEIHLPHTSETVDGCTVHNVDNGALMACFDGTVTDAVVKYIADKQPLRVVFRDSSFPGDAERINVEETFKNLSPDTKVKVI